MEDSNRIRKQLQPLQLIQLVIPFPHAFISLLYFMPYAVDA